MAAHPFSIRFPGVGRAIRYCPTDESAETTVVGLLRANQPAVEVHYKNRLLDTFTQVQWRTLLAEHGTPHPFLPGRFDLPPEHFLIHRITAAVAALGDAPAMPSGKRQKAAVAILVAGGISEAAAIKAVTVEGPIKAVLR